MLHAAAVGTADGGVLIVGRGGVGKSTTALACLAAGMKYVADDYLVVQLDPEPRAFQLYGTAKLEASQLRHFPELQNFVSKSRFCGKRKARTRSVAVEQLSRRKVAAAGGGADARFAPVSATEIVRQSRRAFCTRPHSRR